MSDEPAPQTPRNRVPFSMLRVKGQQRRLSSVMLMAHRRCQQFKVSQTGDCLVAGHVLGLSCAGCTPGWQSYSHQCHSTDGAELLSESSGCVSARRNRPEAEQFTGHRREEGFTSDEHSRAEENGERDRERESENEGRKGKLIRRESSARRDSSRCFRRRLPLWKFDFQSSKSSQSDSASHR